MSPGESTFQYLYLSRLAPAHDFSVYKPIVHAARRYNPSRGISGALLFDGERFCQLLEGPGAAVNELARRIERDARHVDLQVLHAASASGTGALPGWRSGYCGAEELDVLADAAGPRGADAVRAFALILATADLSD